MNGNHAGSGGVRGTMGNTEKDNMEKSNMEKDNNEKDSIEKEDNLEKAKVEMAGQFSADVKLKECKYCRMLIPKSAKVCPNCKMQLKSRWLLYLLIILVLAALCAAGIYYRDYLSKFVESAEAVQSTDVVGTMENTDAVIEMSAADIGEEAQNVDNDRPEHNGISADDGQNTSAAIETQDADSDAKKTAADTEDIEVSAVMDSFEVVRSEEKEDILSDAGLTGVDSDRSKEASEVSDDPDKTSAEDDADVKAADRRKSAKTSGTETAEETDEKEETDKTDKTEELDETEEDTAEIMEIDIQDYTEEEFRDICEQIDYKSLLRKQDIYLNAAVKEELTVMGQVDGGLFDDNVYYLCMKEDRKGITRYYIVRDDREEDNMPILEGDVLVIYGQLFDSCKLPSDMVSTQPVVPALTMVYYELLDE